MITKTNLQITEELLNGCGEIESLGSPKCEYGCLCNDCLIKVETWKMALERELEFLQGCNVIEDERQEGRIKNEISDIKASLDKLKEARI